MEVSGQPHAPAALLPVREPRYPLSVGWVGHRVSEDMLEKGKILSSAGNRTPDNPVHCPVELRYLELDCADFQFHFSVKQRGGLAKGWYPVSHCMVEIFAFISNCYYHV